MKLTTILSTIIATVAFVSCGKEQKSAAPTPTTESAPAAPENLPAAAIIAVPVDDNGVEDTNNADMRLIQSNDVSMDTNNAANLFAAGQAPDQVLTTELDQTSSTESYCGWTNYRGPRYPVNRGYGNNYGYNNGGYGNGYGYQNYSPTYYYRGTPYNWQYQNRYQSRGTNYYYYQRPQGAYGRNGGRPGHGGGRY